MMTSEDVASRRQQHPGTPMRLRLIVVVSVGLALGAVTRAADEKFPAVGETPAAQNGPAITIA
jgi:hypothetical protein